MALHKLSELEGVLLDAAVAKAMGWTWRIVPVTSEDRHVTRDTCMVPPAHGWDKRITDWNFFCPSSDWKDSGWIIDWHFVSLQHCPATGGHPAFWSATMWPPGLTQEDPEDGQQVPKMVEQFGPTALVASARCFVASKFGDEVEL